MGVDARLFAKNAKKYVDFDRLYNLADVWSLEDEDEGSEGTDLFESAQKSNMFFKGGLTKTEVLRLIELNRKAVKENPEETRGRTYYFDLIERFVQAVGEDTYFVLNDQGDEFYDLAKECEEFK